ncbi:MAG: hypothetical protein V4667_03515 [Bacteroidota bacterium]
MIKNLLNTKSIFLLLICFAMSSLGVVAQTITSFAPASVSAGTTTVLTITGTAFGTGGPTSTMYVEFDNADDGAGGTFVQPIASEYISWSATQIVVRVPSDAGTGIFRVRVGGTTVNSPSNITVTYDLMNVESGGLMYKTDHINKQAGGYTWQMETSFAANAPANASFIRSLESWRCATYINWGLGTTTAVNTIAADGVNVVRFDSGAELPPGVLGRCTSRWTACGSGATMEWWVYELDIVFDSGTTWQFGPAAVGPGQSDFESVSLHELGHGHQLAHVNEPTADVMNYSLTVGTSRRALTAGNINGGLAVMAKSVAANTCTPAPMVALTSGACLLSCPSAPANDLICNATLGAVDGTCLTSQTNVCSGSTGDTPVGCFTTPKTVWYKYVLTAGNMLTINFSSYTFGGSIETALFSGTCGAPVLVGSQCGLPSDTYSFSGITPGTYTFGVSSVAGLEGRFNICATQGTNPCVTPPAHDACATPVTLPIDGTCAASFTNCAATGDFNLGCATSNKTLWYTFTLTGSNDQLALTFSNTAAGFGPNVDLQLYTGACAGLVPVTAKCGTKVSTFTFTGLTAGVAYRLAVSTDAAYAGAFQVCGLQSINPCTGLAPANDNICAATSLPVDATCLTNQRNTCATADYTSGCATSTSTVWYQFNLTGANTVMNVTIDNVTTFGGGNVEMILSSGACATPTSVSTYCGGWGGTIRFTNLSTLTTYYLSVGTTDGTQGTYTICGNQSIDCSVTTLTNDGACGAIALPTNGTCLTGQTNVCATPDTYGGCVTPTAASVYYSFSITAPNNAIRFNFPSNTFSGDVQAYVFRATSCTSFTGIESICAAPASSFSVTNLATGTYYLMIATEVSSTGDFTICGAQYEVPPGTLTGPMQDCAGAIPMCAPQFVETNSYVGAGNQELAGGTCLGTDETNSVWYSISPKTNGTFAFTLTTLRDYDFAVYDLTSYTCADIPTLVPVRCNWSATPGNTGLTTTISTVTPLSEGGSGVPTMPGLNVLAGSQYLIIIDNFSGDNNGYQLNFTGTAQLFDNVAPVMTGLNSCVSNEITLSFSEEIFCDSIKSNEFILVNTITGTDYTPNITAVNGSNCEPGFYTDQIIIGHGGGMPSGTYKLITNLGKLQDRCGNIIPPGVFYQFDYMQDITLVANTDQVCTAGDQVRLKADGAAIGGTYTLNPGNLTSSIDVLENGSVVSTTGLYTVTPFTTTYYEVTTTLNGCTKSAGLTITLVNNLVAAVDPVNLAICAGTTNTTIEASASIDGVDCTDCTYLWGGGQTTQTISVPAGVYTVTARTKKGCPSANTATSTIKNATLGAAQECNIYYVSPSGGVTSFTDIGPDGVTTYVAYTSAGSGLLKTDPTTLQNALQLSLCQNAIIKCTKGVYNLDNKLSVIGYVTIEGGFDATFTSKSSDLSGGANSTTIRRSSTLDVGSTKNVTAIDVVSGSALFRFQDLRIELPGSANVAKNTRGLGINNFGIKMGSTCSNYNIVRCYIDAGKGSDQ